MANKLISIARRMKADALNKTEPNKKADNLKMVASTIQTYINLAAKIAKREGLSDDQKQQVMKEWANRRRKNAGPGTHIEDTKDAEHVHVLLPGPLKTLERRS